MKQALPDQRVQSVNDLQRGADCVLEHNAGLLVKPPPPLPIVAPPAVLAALSMSIRYRELLTAATFGDATGGDEGHRFMVAVLKYCRSILRFSRQVARVVLQDEATAAAAKKDQDEGDNNESKTENELDGIGGRFQAFLLEEEEDEDLLPEEEITDEKIRQHEFPTFDAPPPAPEQEMDIEQILINGDDRFQAICLLHTLDDLMSTVDQHYGLLKRCLRGQDQHLQTSSPIQLLMECAAAANLATNGVRVAENSLMANHPHLSSFYHILTLVFLTNYVADVKTKIAPAKLQNEPHMALHFVATILECSFHNKGDERIPGKVKRFAKKSGVPLAVLEKEAQKINIMALLEVQLTMEERMNSHRNNLLRSTGMQPHMWLQNCSYIGNERCILNTQNLLQKLMDILQDNRKLIARPGFWGAEFEEDTKPASSIRRHLDELFAGSIMPELLEICRQAPWNLLPERSQLIPVIDLLHHHLKGGDKTSPVPIALSFGLHAMLTSIFVLQGDGDLARIANYAKQSYNTLFAQLDECSNPSKRPQNAPNFYLNVGLFKNLVNFAEPVEIRGGIDPRLPILDRAIAERLAFWNPVIGGEYMLYATYICSIGMGSATVDTMGQLRFTLHLYNALKQRSPSCKVPFLQNLDKVFAKTKAVWVGGRPEQGSYCKNFWIAWGMSISEASRVAFECARSNGSSPPSIIRNRIRHSADMIRTLDEIHPEEYSASYRRIVLQDFSDEEGVTDYTVRNATKNQKTQYQGLFELLTRVNITRDSMDDDEDIVLPVNFTVVGCILLEFTNALSEYMGWDALIDQVVGQNPEPMRTGKTMGGERMIGVNASDLNWKRQGLAHLWGDMMSRLDANTGGAGNGQYIDKVADFMSNFFQNVPREKFAFFIENENQPTSSQRRNPLEGSYPYGRTGRTPRDPLQGFCHFKYSKRGEPVVRFIKPGKYTPYHPTESGDVATPYEERGSRMPREASGKYRHIASYSLEELIALDWDGAMYISTKGRHAAKGQYVPFIVGYNSDADDEHEPIDIQRGKRAGTIGLPANEVGLYMAIPDMSNPGRQQFVQIKNAH